jgi:hypothetical protein
MAIQKGIIKLKGAIGDITFAQTKHGYTARESSSISADRIRTDPKFIRTRENGAEFGRAAKAGKMLRKAFRVLLLQTADADMANRLTSRMMKVIKADPVSRRGLRNMLGGDTKLLKGFDFNINAPLDRAFVAPYTVSISRATGENQVSIAAFSPAKSIVAPPGATHCRIITSAVSVDFQGEVYSGITNRSADIDVTALNQAAIVHNSPVEVNPALPIFIVIGVEFFETVNQEQYPLLNGAFNALSIIHVDRGSGLSRLQQDPDEPQPEEQQQQTEDQQP